MPATVRIHDGYSRPIHETVVDGVQTFWAECDAPFSAWLVFRVGRADESLLTRGITHLVEHLAFPPHDNFIAHVDGIVRPLVTVFEGEGEKREVLGVIADVAASLNDLPLRRLELERRILREESFAGSRWTGSQLAWKRFGARYLGLDDEPELGLYRLSAAQVGRWAKNRFTAENAVLCLTSRPPRGLSLCLPHGRRIPPPAPPVTPVPVPGWFTWSSGSLAISTMAEASVATRFAAEVAERRLEHLLRYELGISYSASLRWQRLGYGTIQHIVEAGVLDGYEQLASAETVRLFDELAATGPTARELRWQKQYAVYHDTPMAQLPQWLDNLAVRQLFGEEARSTEAWLAAVKRLTPRDVRAAFRQMLDTALLCTPEDVELDHDRFPRLPIWSGDPTVTGRRFNGLADEEGAADQLVVGDDGISYIDETGVGTIHFSKAAALVRREGSPETLYRLDGNTIQLDGVADWPRGKAALRAVSEMTPRRLVIDIP